MRKKVDFTIVSRPDYIHFRCPYCDEDVNIDWKDIDVPESWCDPWGEIECPECGEVIELADWDYD